MQEVDNNLGHSCRKKAAIQSRHATRKLQVQIRHALRWLHGACMQEDGSNLGQGCRKKAAIHGRHEEDGSNPRQTCKIIAAT